MESNITSNIFDKKPLITTDTDLLNLIDKLCEGNVQAYCNLKDYFLCRFPLTSLHLKNNRKQLTARLLKDKSDKGNNSYAQAFLGWMYWSGTGVAVNDELAKMYIAKSSSQKNPMGLVEMGFLHMVGAINAQTDEYSALNLFEEAMQLDATNGYAQYALGTSILLGDSNLENAAKYLKSALSSEIPSAAQELGHFYLHAGRFKDAYELYGLTPYVPSVAYGLGTILTWLRPAQCPIPNDYVKGFQCYLVADKSGFSHAKTQLKYYKNSKISDVHTVTTNIENTFTKMIEEHENSDSLISICPDELFLKMEKDFRLLRELHIDKQSLYISVDLSHYIDFCYYQCVLSSHLRSILQPSYVEKIFQNITGTYERGTAYAREYIDKFFDYPQSN